MRRPRFRKAQTQVSLFPFLAVLICTMGGLIVLLVLVVQQARVDARQVSDNERQVSENEQTEAVADSKRDDLQREYDDHEWRREVLQQQRVEKTEELSDRRLELGHLEEHLRELQERWRSLARQLKQAEDRDQQDDQSLDARRNEIERMRQAVAEAERAVDDARKKAADAPRSYTIVPYQGPNGTRRRPIYLECTATGVVIRPPGTRLPLADFQGPLGPGNPLDAALRAIREHWRNLGAGDEPYPLLLVRPDGVQSYAGARAALKAWDDEFGYELVSAEMNLKFPPGDDGLKPLLEQTVQTARRRQRALAANMPSHYGRGAATGYIATRNGFVAVGGSGRGAGGGARRGRFGPGAGHGSSRGAGNDSLRGVGSGAGRGFGGAAAAGQSASRGGEPHNSQGSQTAGSGFYPNSDPSRNGLGPANGDQAGAGQAGTDQAGTDQAGTGDGSQTASERPGGMNDGSRHPGQRNQAEGSSSASRGPAGQAMSGGEAGGTAAAGHRQPGRPGNFSGGSALGGMANSRGSDWALPKSGPGATGVTRPLRIDCYADRLVIVPEASDKRPPRVVEFPGSTAKSVDTFVSAVWEEMDRWGIALANGYWKPVLQVRVAPGAETRFREVQTVLEDSGLVVKRRSP